MTFVEVVPIAEQSGTLVSQPRAVGALEGVTLRLDCLPFAGKTSPFVDPAMQVMMITSFSWDGGSTFPDWGATLAFGNPNGWGKGGGQAPLFSREVPTNTVLGGRPNQYRAELSISAGPITLGASVEEY